MTGIAHTVEKLMGPLKRQIRMTVARCVVRLIDDEARMQRLQVSLLADETRDGAEHFQPYGFTHHPHPGAEGIVLHPFGQRAHPLVVMVDDRRYRLTGLAKGEVALYSDEGDKVVLKRGRVVEVTTEQLLVKANTKVRFETPILEVTGDIRDTADSNTTTVRDMRAIYDGHVHDENDSGGPTDPPNAEMGGTS